MKKKNCLWVHWWNILSQFEGLCPRKITFYWMALVLAAFCIREDLMGVSSFVRAWGLYPDCYPRLLYCGWVKSLIFNDVYFFLQQDAKRTCSLCYMTDEATKLEEKRPSKKSKISSVHSIYFFHAPALDLQVLTQSWVAVVLRLTPGIVRVNERIVLLGDGLKIPKSGKKMPGVKRLHQSSESNTKAAYINGHSCQAVALLVKAGLSFLAIPLSARIHEGVVFSNRDKRTLLDKMIELVNALGISLPFYLVADAYYASGKIVRGLREKGNHLITRVGSNAVAYIPLRREPGKRGRPKKYGHKIKLRSLFSSSHPKEEASSPLYGEKNVILSYCCMDLLWRPVGCLVRFVAVEHPHRGRILLMSTDLELDALEIIRLYGLRFKIEFSFKQSLHVAGGYAYHFWMKEMPKAKRNPGDQHVHRKSETYRKNIQRKLGAYHRHIQLGLMAQGIMQILSAQHAGLIWEEFGSWIRTIGPGLAPSELVVSLALRNTLPEFLADSSYGATFKKFLRNRIDLTKAQGIRLVA